MMFRPWQLRAIREACGWSQGQLAKKAGVSQPTISSLEKGETEDPNTKTINAIIASFAAEGFYFTQNGIEQKSTNTFTIEGVDCYLELLNDIEETLEPGQEFLKSGANERRSSDAVVRQIQRMRDRKISSRSLIKANDTFIMGRLDEYRWMDQELFTEGDVKLIYNNRVAYLVTWTDIPKIIVLEDRIIAEEARRTFDYIWNNSQTPSHSDATRFFEGVNNG